MKLDDIIDLKVLQKIQDYFSRATGFAAVTVDYRGRPLLEYSWFCKFCTILRKDPILNEKCCQSDAHGSLEAVRRNGIYIYKCHAGLIDIAIPIIVEGEYLASMLCGQVRAEESTVFKDDIISPTHNLLAENPELEDEYNRIITVPDDRIEGTANLLNITMKYIVDQYLLNQRNMKLLQDRMERVDMEKLTKDMEFKNYHPQVNHLPTLDARQDVDHVKRDKEMSECIPKSVTKEVEAALQYINKHYMDNLSLAEVADAVYLSSSYLSRLFKREVGVNLSTYLLHKKLDEAKRLLKDTEIPICNISSSLSFSDASYFCKVFKKYFGFTPKGYRHSVGVGEL